MNIYGLFKKSTVITECGRLWLEDDFENYFKDFRNQYKIIGPVNVQGYINNGCCYVAPYSGKYGEGVVVCKPEYYMGRKSTKYMKMYYYIRKED